MVPATRCGLVTQEKEGMRELPTCYREARGRPELIDAVESGRAKQEYEELVDVLADSMGSASRAGRVLLLLQPLRQA